MSVAASTPRDAVQAHLDAWSRHDPEGVVATLAEGGTYADPATGGPLTGPALAAYAAGLFSTFPDLAFELVGGGVVAARWLMRGTNTGPRPGGLPPGGRTVALTGVDVVEVDAEGIRAVIGYFDRQSLWEQLGLQVVVQPHALGPVTFGTATHRRGGRTAPAAAVSVTTLEARSEAEVEEIQARARGDDGPRRVARLPGLAEPAGRHAADDGHGLGLDRRPARPARRAS